MADAPTVEPGRPRARSAGRRARARAPRTTAIASTHERRSTRPPHAEPAPETAASPSAAAEPRSPAPRRTCRRVRARLARLGAQRRSANPVLEPLFRIVRADPPEGRPAADRAGLRRRRAPPPRAAAQERRPVHHPSARGDDDPRRARHDAADAVRGAAARHGRGHAVHPRRAARGLRRRGRATWSTASPSSTRSSTASRRRPRPCARWSSRWPATSGCSSSSSPTGCTTCAPSATSARRSRSGRPARRLEIYAPLAHRLGMNTLKWELEDLAFATLYPKVYDEIVRLVTDRAPSRDDYLERRHRPRQRRPARRQDPRRRSPGGRSTTTRSTRR